MYLHKALPVKTIRRIDKIVDDFGLLDVSSFHLSDTTQLFYPIKYQTHHICAKGKKYNVLDHISMA